MKGNSEWPRLAVCVLFLSCCSSMRAADSVGCEFDRKGLRFTGSSAEQAKCLLRPVLLRGKLGESLSGLPKPLQCIDGQLDITKPEFNKYLATNKIDPKQLGGELEKRIAQAQGGQVAAYFVIHDTSTPNFHADEFATDIDWSESINALCRWNRGADAQAHVFINRRGESLTALDFSTPWRATKFENQYGSTALRGLFLHVELAQPRRADPTLGKGNDALAPNPGFTSSQYKRLALVYLAASVRKGSCLIPAYHSVLDAGLPEGHDDPQNFSLDAFANEVQTIRDAVRVQ